MSNDQNMAGADVCDACSMHVHIRKHVLLMRQHIPEWPRRSKDSILMALADNESPMIQTGSYRKWLACQICILA